MHILESTSIRKLVRLGCLSALLLLGCAEGNVPTDESSQFLAAVNGTAITAADFERTYVDFLISDRLSDTSHNRYLHFDNLINRYLLAEEARERDLDQDSTFLRFEERSHKMAIGSRFYETAFLKALPPMSNVDVQDALHHERQVVVRHLFYQTERNATRAYNRLRNGRSFLDEAQRCYRTAAYDSLAGYLGPIRYFQTDRTFAEAAFSLNVGAYSVPIRSQFGFHIIRVEDQITPLSSEPAYQGRTSGFTEQFQLHTQQLKGDEFVRRYMHERNVQINTDGIHALALTLYNTKPELTEPLTLAPGVHLPTLDLDVLQTTFTSETVLATYHIEGRTHTFTVQDYFLWLDDLSFAEALQQTITSVGKALRNEVFAQAGINEGLENDPVVRQQTDNLSRIYLASAMELQLYKAFLNGAQENPESYLRDLRSASAISINAPIFRDIIRPRARI